MVVSGSEQSGGWTQRSGSSHRSAFQRIKKTKYVKTWLTQFVSYVQLHYKKSYSALSVKERHKLVRTFCSQHFSTFDERFFHHGTSEEKRTAWRLVRSLSYLYPEVALQDFGLGFGGKHNLLVIDEVTHRDEAAGESSTRKSIVISMLQASPALCSNFDDVLLLEDGEVVFHGAAGAITEYFQELGFVCPAGADVYDFLLGLGSRSTQSQYSITVTETSASSSKHVRQMETAGALVRFADDMVFVAGVSASAAAAQASLSDVAAVEKQHASSSTSTFETETTTTEGEVVYTTETKTTVVHHTSSHSSVA